MQLARSRPTDNLYPLLGATAFYWVASSTQYAHDFVGYPILSLWFAWAVDASLGWVVVLTLLVSFELGDIAAPRLRAFLVVSTTIATVVTMPLWQWDKYALMAQVILDALVAICVNVYLVWHAARKPSHVRIVVALANLVFLGMGLHDTYYLTHQANPDHIYLFPFGSLVTFVIFMYATNRRYLQTLATAERYQIDLEERLQAQQRQLDAQHETLREFEIKKSLAAQHEALTLDLHDRVGSAITSSIHQARSGQLDNDEIVLLLHDIGNEVRSISHMNAAREYTVGEVLADLRHRIQPRLRHGAIQLTWEIDPHLPTDEMNGTKAAHLTAMLSEAVANIIKHAQSSVIHLKAYPQDASTHIEIVDNGKGFDLETAEKGRGLVGMQHRASLIGANLHIESHPGQGTAWHLTLPSRL